VASATKVKWNVNEGSINRILASYIKKNEANIEKLVEDYAEKASLVIRNDYILKGSPTGTRWHQFVNAERGNAYGARYETGDMARAVGYQAYGMNANGVVGAEFGLPDEAYYLAQEYGFVQENEGGNRVVKGMNSAKKTIKALTPDFRKRMLALGFLKGAKDARGSAVLGMMSQGNTFLEAWVKTAPNRSLAQREAWAEIVRGRQEAEERLRVDYFKAQSSRELANLAMKFPALAAELYRQSPTIDVRPFISKIGNN
jgi:hypothetical protein